MFYKKLHTWTHIKSRTSTRNTTCNKNWNACREHQTSIYFDQIACTRSHQFNHTMTNNIADYETMLKPRRWWTFEFANIRLRALLRAYSDPLYSVFEPTIYNSRRYTRSVLSARTDYKKCFNICCIAFCVTRILALRFNTNTL